MPLVLDYDLTRLRGAEYNPRKITPEQFELLQESLRTLGFVKPVIATTGGLLVAGHQRTKAALAAGIQYGPVYFLDSIQVADEITMNQLHNGTDTEVDGHDIRVPPSTVLGFEDVPGDQIEGSLLARGAPIRTQICNLMLKYGNWGCAVASQSGEVCSAGQYALACKKLGLPCRIHRIPDALVETARKYFGVTYGRFSYDHIPKTTYMQALVQPRRFRAGELSKLYESRVLPDLKPEETLIDFGCGFGYAMKGLRLQGREATGVEFFYRDGYKAIDKGTVHRMCADIARRLETHGRFDVVVCDAVISSVDSLQAESDVLHCLNALCKPGGRIYICGRRREWFEQTIWDRKCRTEHRRIEFIAPDGLSAIYRNGGWIYFKYHYQDEALTMGETHFGPCTYAVASNMYHLVVPCKTVELPQAACEEAIMREFNLGWPDGTNVGWGERIVTAYRKALAVESAARVATV